MDTEDRLQRRKWADIVVVVTSVWSFGQAVWGPALLTQASQDRGATTLWVIAGIAGLLGVLGLFVTARNLAIGRAMIVLAGLMHLAGPFAYRVLAPLPMSFAVLSGVALLAAAWFVGPLRKPAPQGDSPL